MSPVISPNELFHLLREKNTVCIHAGMNAKELYDKQHIKGAVYLDLNQHLSDIKDPKYGGRHPLPPIEDFNQTLGKFGINENTHILIYDDKNGAIAASRLWWMLTAINHLKVQIINGGLDAIKKVGIDLTCENTNITPVSRDSLPFQEWQLPTVKMNQVERFTQDDSKIIVDVRAKERFEGITEPLDPIAGHIPSAINIPFSTNLDEDGFFLSEMELKKKYMPLFENHLTEDITFHCGSGVTACHSLLALTYAGFETPNLYVGSWSEWCRNH